jgi:hypothetical protein
MAPAAPRLAEIDRRYRWAANEARKGRPKRRFNIAWRRITELNLLFTARYGLVLPDDDAGHADILITARHIACARGEAAPRCIRDWIGLRAPWMVERGIEALIARAARHPIPDRPDNLARKLNLTDVQRTALKITTIGSVDVTKAQRVKRRKQHDQERKCAQRRAEGAKPQAESLSRTKPWVAAGMSRAGWYRARAKATETTSSTA